MSIVRRLDGWLARLVAGRPKQVIGKELSPNHLMERFHLLHFELLPRWPYVRAVVPSSAEDKTLPKLVLHRFLRGDNRRKGIHTHPWWCLSWVVLGSYTERVQEVVRRPDPSLAGFDRVQQVFTDRTRGWLSVAFNPVTHVHVVTETGSGEPCWTLAILGPWEQEWGFPEVGQVVRDAAGRKVS